MAWWCWAWLVWLVGGQATEECALDGTCTTDGVQTQSLLQKRAVRSSLKEGNSKSIGGVKIGNLHKAKHVDKLFDKSNTDPLEDSDPAEWAVWFKPATTDADIHSFCDVIKTVCGEECLDEAHPDSGGAPYAGVKCSKDQLLNVVDTWGNDKIAAFEAAELVESDVPWNLDRIDQPNLPLDNAAFAGAGEKGRGVHVYVVDTGVRITHTTFGGRALGGWTAYPEHASCHSSTTNCAGDAHSHGTHCAGTVGGAGYGVATEAQIYAVKVLSDEGWGSSVSVFGGMEFVVENGHLPAVMSMSLGGPGVTDGYLPLVIAAAAKGIVVVVAAGNSNADACSYSPAYVRQAITVGSTDRSDSRSYFSNYGSCVDLFAPGSDVLSASNEDDSGTNTFSGTSMACPAVAGAVATLMSNFMEFRTVEEITEVLLRQALPDKVVNPLGDNLLLSVSTEIPEPPPPTPAPAPGMYLRSGPCIVDGQCFTSSYFPGQYDNDETCVITIAGEVDLTMVHFATEQGWDHLYVNNGEYSGTSGPPDGPVTGEVIWRSDGSVVRDGWKFCYSVAPPTHTTWAPPTHTTWAPPTHTTWAPPTHTTWAPPTYTTWAPPTYTTWAPPTYTTWAPPTYTTWAPPTYTTWAPPTYTTWAPPTDGTPAPCIHLPPGPPGPPGPVGPPGPPGQPAR